MQRKLMQRAYDVWQRCSSDWLSVFIRENLMTLGYTPWQGYMTQGRGLVVCNVTVDEAVYSNLGGDVMSDRPQYIASSEVVAYLERHNLSAETTDILTGRVQTYCPSKEMLVFMERKGEISFSLLANLAITLPDCYWQVCNRWEEFYLQPRSIEIAS